MEDLILHLGLFLKNLEVIADQLWSLLESKEKLPLPFITLSPTGKVVPTSTELRPLHGRSGNISRSGLAPHYSSPLSSPHKDSHVL